MKNSWLCYESEQNNSYLKYLKTYFDLETGFWLDLLKIKTSCYI